MVQELLLEVGVNVSNRGSGVGTESLQVFMDLLNTEIFCLLVEVALVGKHVVKEFVQPSNCKLMATVHHFDELGVEVLIQFVVTSSLVDESLASLEVLKVRDYLSGACGSRCDDNWVGLWRLGGRVVRRFRKGLLLLRLRVVLRVSLLLTLGLIH